MISKNLFSWQQVSATPLTGLQFNDIRALSSTNVWVAAVANGGGGPAYLVHSLWGVGSKQTTTNGSAVIWAYGTV